ncbi:MAG TPA: hypothetical protein VGD49_13935 [Longimicrobiales bacterium]
MKSVQPEDLAPHRAFFTEFDRYGDPSRFSTPGEQQGIALLLERKLKLYLLTKAHVVVAGSQLLESPFAHDLVLRHPALLESGALIASIKTGHESSVQFLDVKRAEVQHRPASPYHSDKAADVAALIDSSGTSVRWPLSAMSDWFRGRLADDLADDSSLIRVALRREGIILPPTIVDKIRAEQGLSRGTVDRIVAETRIPHLRDVMRLYADFIYYLSGARATASEGILPQENLVDFSLGELVGRKTSLSDHEVFFKIFIDLVKARTHTTFPDEFLDAISIPDALELRKISLSKKFVDAYNEIQQRTKEAIHVSDPERLVLLLGELDEYETGLHAAFEDALSHELPSRTLEKRQRAGGKVLQAVTSLIIPAADVKEIVVSGLEWTGFDKAAAAVSDRVARGLVAVETALENMNLLERQLLLDFVDAMKRKYAERLFTPSSRTS